MTASTKQKLLGSFPLALFVSLITLEIANYLFTAPLLGQLGMIFWALMLLTLLFVAGKLVLSFFINDREKGRVWVYLTWLFFSILIVVNAAQPSNISFETTQEAACSINFLRNTSDWGFHRACFLGYPARQYFLMAVPTLLFGPSQLALNLGGSLFFVLGMIIWAVGLYKYLEKRGNHPGFITSLSLLLLLHFHYFNHFLFHCFEQSQFPLSFSLMFWGLYLLREVKTEIWQLPAIGFVMLLLAQSYTPSIAFLTLAVVMIFLISPRDKGEKLAKWLVIFGSLISLFVSFSYRYDVKLVSEQSQTLDFFLGEAQLLLQHLFVRTQGAQEYGTMLGRSLLPFSVLAPLFIKKKKYWLLAGWSIVVVFVATASAGYSFYHLNFRVHRSIVVLPTTLLLVSLIGQRFFSYVLRLINSKC